MDAETIKREAGEALRDLELDSVPGAVTQSGKNWCIQFSGDYGQFCDSFQNQFEHDNSPRVIREKIKKHLLGQITLLRNKGGRRTTKKGFDEQEGGPNVTELFQEAMTQTTRAIGEAIDRTLGVTRTAIESAGDVAETVTTGTAEVLRTAERESAPPRAKPVRAATKKRSAKSTGKTKRSGAGKTASKQKRAAGTKKATRKKSSRKG